MEIGRKITTTYSPVNQTPSARIAESFHPEYRKECPGCPGETGDGSRERREFVQTGMDLKHQKHVDSNQIKNNQYCERQDRRSKSIGRESDCEPTLTISEPSISFSLERLSLILSGWALHFNRSSISPAGKEREICIYKYIYIERDITVNEGDTKSRTDKQREIKTSCLFVKEYKGNKHLASQIITTPFNYSPPPPKNSTKSK